MLRGLTIAGKLSKTDNLNAGQGLTFNMDRSDGYKNLFYDFLFTVTHDNAAALTTDTYKFLKNFLLNIKFVTGAGDNIFDLNSTQMLIVQLIEEGRLRYSIDKTIGNGKVSTIMLRWNFTLPKHYEHPMDTVFHGDNDKYNYVQIKMTPQKVFDSVADCTIVGAIDVKIKEVFKQNPTPKKVPVWIDGKQVLASTPPMNKVVKTKELGFNSSVTGQVIELPKSSTILGFYAYVVDGNGDIKAGGITNISIKNGNQYFYDMTFTEANEENRDKIQTWSNVLLDNIAFVDIAQGQMTEALNTDALMHSNTVISLDLVATAGDNILKIMYLTVEDA